MVEEPFLADKARWALRSRVYGDPGGAWGAHGDPDVSFEPVEWTVTRRLNEPAVAQVVIDPGMMNYEQRQIIRGMIGAGDHANRTFGLSCFRDDFKEEDAGDAIFFGPVTSIDLPADGPVTIHAADMMHLSKGILVGTHDIKNATPAEILAVCQSEWVRQFPRASGLDFKGDVSRRVDYKVDITDLKTLYDVIQDLIGVFNCQVYHDRSIDLQIVEPPTDTAYTWDSPETDQLDNYGVLHGSSITRLFGPESQPNVIRVAGGDNTEAGRKVATSQFVPNDGNEFVTGLAVQGSHGVNETELARAAESLRDRYQEEAITASIRVPWLPRQNAPRPGEVATARVAIDYFRNPESEHHQTKNVEGVIQSVVISQDFYDIEVTSEGGR